ncbi:phospholipase D2 isoform X2 [Tetranychus urticae]|nr:phospholipase D2 isoform X2 [Tetranychus urticae]
MGETEDQASISGQVNKGFVDIPLGQMNQSNNLDETTDETDDLIPFMRVHSVPTAFYPSEAILIPEMPIKAKFIETTEAPNSHYIDQYLYSYELTHGPFTWVIRKKHSNFLYLHQQLKLFLASLSLPLASRGKSSKRRSVMDTSGTRKGLPEISFKPDTFLAPEETRARPKMLEEYLNALLSIQGFREHESTLNFLEISRLSFVNHLGHKGLESFVQKKDGGHAMVNCCIRAKYIFSTVAMTQRKRWLILKDSFIAYLHPNTGSIRCVLLMDRLFKAIYDPKVTGDLYSVRITNLSRDLDIRCWTKRLASEWTDTINRTATTLGKDYTQPNRYESFAPPRPNTPCQWYVDGVSYFEAVAEALDSAKEEIFITGWWLSPEIYLKRPVIHGDIWRLDILLSRKASQGVAVFILVYKEIELALQISSVYTKKILMGLHPNIKILRHPDIVKGATIFWSHHEKVVVVDQKIAFVSGIDLCYGRWDTFQHRLTDLGDISKKVIEDPLNDSIDKANQSVTEKNENPSLFSVTCALMNAKRQESQKKGDDKFKNSVSFLVPESKDNVTTFNDNNGDKNNNNHPNNDSSSSNLELRPAVSSQTLFRVVANLKKLRRHTIIRRSSSLDSLDDIELNETEKKCALRRTPSELGLTDLSGGNKLWIGKDYCNFIAKDPCDFNRPFEDSIDRRKIVRMPWHDVGMMVEGNAAKDVARHFIERWNFTKCQKAQFHSKYDWLCPKSTNGAESLPSSDKKLNNDQPNRSSFRAECQLVRSVSDWSTGTKFTESSIYEAYIDIIDNSRHYIYIENQFFITRSGGLKKYPREVVNEVGEAIVRRIIRAYRANETFRVYIIIPLLPAFEGELGTSTGANLEIITHWNLKSICRGNDALLQRLQREIGDITKYISFFSLRNHGELNDKPVTELVYVHSKIILADDRVALIGSSNINDRSLTGSRDSEVACVIRDTEMEDGLMNGEPYQCGKFIGSLRRYLFREHLGSLQTKSGSKSSRIDVRDPISDAFYFDTWLKIAQSNTKIYDEVFGVIPSDEVYNYEQLRQRKSKAWLVDTDVDLARVKIGQIKGHLVCFPLNFLKDENLEPSAASKASLVPLTVWT